jgi:hypothetical protein
MSGLQEYGRIEGREAMERELRVLRSREAAPRRRQPLRRAITRAVRARRRLEGKRS